MAEGPLNDTDSITSGYSVPWARKRTSPSLLASSSKTLMNSRPMILRFCSGSLIPAKAPRNLGPASANTKLILNLSRKILTTYSASLCRSRPLSTKMQVN